MKQNINTWGHSTPAGCRSAGMGMIGMLLALSAAAAILTLTLRLGPHYIDWQTMQSVFNGLPKAQVAEMSPGSIREMVAKGFRVNSLRDFDLRHILTIDRAKGGTTLTVAYEQREHIVFNVDVVISFEEQFRY